MQCNIDARGKAVRLRIGIVLVVIGLLLLFAWAWPRQNTAAWIIAISCLISGAFCVYEGWAGWCAVRAMGFKTKV